MSGENLSFLWKTHDTKEEHTDSFFVLKQNTILKTKDNAALFWGWLFYLFIFCFSWQSYYKSEAITSKEYFITYIFIFILKNKQLQNKQNTTLMAWLFFVNKYSIV